MAQAPQPFAGIQKRPIKVLSRHTMIRAENGQLAVHVPVDFRDRDLAGYVADARRADDRRHGEFDASRASRDPRDLWDHQRDKVG
jgi:membrane carboxypeptidase/penicillin-binding protein PbpC